MRKKISYLVMFLIVITMLFTTLSFATELDQLTDGQNENEPIEYEDYEITEHDIFEMHNGDYDADLLVDGNAYILANGNVTIKGEINGNAYIFARGKVVIEEGAVIYDSLYVMAENVMIKGNVYDLYCYSINYEMNDTAYIARDLNLVSENAKLRGKLIRNANISAENIDVKDDTSALIIGHDFNYTSKNKIEGLEEIVNSGEIIYNEAKKVEVEPSKSTTSVIKSSINKIITSIIYVLIIYFLFKAVAPKFSERIEKDLKEKSIVSFAIGLLAYVLIFIVIIVTILLLLTIIGIPIALISWILMILGIYISPAVFQIAVYEIIARKYEKIKNNIGFTILVLIGVSVIFEVVKLIPYLGGIVNFVTLTMGLGLLIRNIVSREKKQEKQDA